MRRRALTLRQPGTIIPPSPIAARRRRSACAGKRFRAPPFRRLGLCHARARYRRALFKPKPGNHGIGNVAQSESGAQQQFQRRRLAAIRRGVPERRQPDGLDRRLYNNVTNPITRRFGTANLAGVKNVPFYWNTPSYKIYGLDVSASYDSDHIFGNLGLSWMNGSRNGAINNVYGPDTYANDLSPFTANLQLGYKLPDWDLALSWNGQFVAAQENTPANQGGATYARPESPGYAVHGIAVDWTPKEGLMAGLEVHASVDNLFDKYYFPISATALPPCRGAISSCRSAASSERKMTESAGRSFLSRTSIRASKPALTLCHPRA